MSEISFQMSEIWLIFYIMWVFLDFTQLEVKLLNVEVKFDFGGMLAK